MVLRLVVIINLVVIWCRRVNDLLNNDICIMNFDVIEMIKNIYFCKFLV